MRLQCFNNGALSSTVHPVFVLGRRGSSMSLISREGLSNESILLLHTYQRLWQWNRTAIEKMKNSSKNAIRGGVYAENLFLVSSGSLCFNILFLVIMQGTARKMRWILSEATHASWGGRGATLHKVLDTVCKIIGFFIMKSHCLCGSLSIG